MGKLCSLQRASRARGLGSGRPARWKEPWIWSWDVALSCPTPPNPPAPWTFQIFLLTRLPPAAGAEQWGVGGACRHTKTRSPKDCMACLQSCQLHSPWGPIGSRD